MAYQKITDLFIATSTDYNPKSEEAYTFFKIVQNKLHYAVEALKQYDCNAPLLYCSNYNVLIDNDHSHRVYEKSIASHAEFGNLIVKNYFPGCTMVYNRSLKRLISRVNPIELNPYPLHDHWVALVCTACGGSIIIDQTATMNYRQHQHNVVGERGILTRVRHSGLFAKNGCVRLNIVKELIKYYSDDIDRECIDLAKIIVMYQWSLRSKIEMIMSKTLLPSDATIIEIAALKLTILINKF